MPDAFQPGFWPSATDKLVCRKCKSCGSPSRRAFGSLVISDRTGVRESLTVFCRSFLFDQYVDASGDARGLDWVSYHNASLPNQLSLDGRAYSSRQTEFLQHKDYWRPRLGIDSVKIRRSIFFEPSASQSQVFPTSSPCHGAGSLVYMMTPVLTLFLAVVEAQPSLE